MDTFDGSDLAASIRGGESSSVAAVTACIERIAVREPEVRAWVDWDPEPALAEARERDEHEAQMSASLRGLLDEGDIVAAPTHAAALALARTALAELPAILRAVDALLVPAVRGEAPAGLDSTGDPLFCRGWPRRRERRRSDRW